MFWYRPRQDWFTLSSIFYIGNKKTKFAALYVTWAYFFAALFVTWAWSTFHSSLMMRWRSTARWKSFFLIFPPTPGGLIYFVVHISFILCIAFCTFRTFLSGKIVSQLYGTLIVGVVGGQTRFLLNNTLLWVILSVKGKVPEGDYMKCTFN